VPLLDPSGEWEPASGTNRVPKRVPESKRGGKEAKGESVAKKTKQSASAAQISLAVAAQSVRGPRISSIATRSAASASFSFTLTHTSQEQVMSVEFWYLESGSRRRSP
jgi:hypothetical protein